MRARNYLILIALMSIAVTVAFASAADGGEAEVVAREASQEPALQAAGAPRPRKVEPLATAAAGSDVAITQPLPAPVPTPEAGAEQPVARQSNGTGGLVLAFTQIAAGVILAALLFYKRQATGPGLQQRKAIAGRLLLVMVVGLVLLGCREPAPDPLPPGTYLENALSWLEANAVTAEEVDWERVRAEATALASDPQTTADTYPAIEYAQAQLDDDLAWFQEPGQSVWERRHIGLTAIYPENLVVEIEVNSPAAETEIEVGDRLLLVNGEAPVPDSYRPNHVDFLIEHENSAPVALRLEREGREFEVTLTPTAYTNEDPPASRALALGERQVAYLELRTDVGTRMYPTRAQAAMAAVDGPNTCGWMIDLRRNKGGDLWTYFAALGPLLGEGELGGFEYADGSQERWAYREGKVLWAGEEREESFVRGPIYQMEPPQPPVALLTSSLTEAAGELVVVAFQGWGDVRTFGEATLGAPQLVLHTPLSDGALLFVSGAQGMDRSGMVYDGPIIPDEPVPVDWQRFGGPDDPVISAALSWLAGQSACTS